MPRPTSGLRRRRTALFAIAVLILMTGGAESDVVEGANDPRSSTSSQELVPPLEGSSTADLQVVGAPKNHDLGSAGADPVQLQSEGDNEDNGEDDEDLSLSDNEHASLDFTEPFQWRKNGWHCSSISSSRDACQFPLSPELEHDAASSRSLLGASTEVVKKSCHKSCKTCHYGTNKYDDCTSCANQSHKLTPERLVHLNGKKVPYGYCWDGKTCHKSCKTCNGMKDNECTSCPGKTTTTEGTLLAARKFTQNKIASPSRHLLGTRPHKIVVNTKVPSGSCQALPELKDFNPSLGVKCRYSECRDAVTGVTAGFAPTDKKVCSRICLMGGSLTKVTHLRRHDNPESKTGERIVDKMFGYESSPVCALHKTVMCTKNTAFHDGNCQKFRNQAGGKAEDCVENNCEVRKEVSCVAILPYRGTAVYTREGFLPLKDVTKELGTNLDAYKNECKHAINPCATLPMLA